MEPSTLKREPQKSNSILQIFGSLFQSTQAETTLPSNMLKRRCFWLNAMELSKSYQVKTVLLQGSTKASSSILKRLLEACALAIILELVLIKL